jgi:hypothetical protein
MLRIHQIGILLILLLTVGCSGISKFLETSEKINNIVNATPDYQPVQKVHYLSDPQWDPSIGNEFYHISQGTIIMPYDWFMALEQPTSLFGTQPLLSKSDYLESFGFIKDDSATNVSKLPIGFAVDENFVNPSTGKKMPMLGLTCAACHTGELRFIKDNQIHAVRIDGGPAMIDPGLFTDAAGLSLGLTAKTEGRFKRFAKRVFSAQGIKHTEDAEKRLKKILNMKVDQGIKANNLYEQTIAERLKLDPRKFQGGFSRTDALDRILNQVFGTNLMKEEDSSAAVNFVPNNAPVNFPHIWDASWFDWVQYNASIHQPIVRNAGEALGVKAPVDFKNYNSLYASSAKIGNLQLIEEWLAGKKPFEGLSSPKWPDNLFPKINAEKAERGKILYKNHCKECHLPPLNELKADLKTIKSNDKFSKDGYWTNKFWTEKRGDGIALLIVKQKEVKDIGTDKTLLENFNNAKIGQTGILDNSGGFDLVGEKDKKSWTRISTGMGMGSALGHVVENVTNRWHEVKKTTPQNRKKINGYRENLIKADWVYKARPLNGIWATAPFLHNGSVPTIFDLLSPVIDRPKNFYLGSKLFNPQKIGFETKAFKGGYLLDTTIKGNSNKGHEFNHKHENGVVIGPYLKPSERYDIIEYLKTL